MPRNLFFAALTVALLGAASGCQPVEPRSAMPEFDRTPPERTAATSPYIAELTGRNVASTWDALRMVYPLTPEGKTERSLNEIEAYFKAEGIVPQRWTLAAEPEPLRAGTLAVMIAHVLELRGGAVRCVFPNSERYAVRELRHRRLMTDTTSCRYVSGADLTGVVRRAAEYSKEGDIR